MSEQKVENKEEEIKPTKENVSEEYLKGYRVGYNRAMKRFKKEKLEIEVKKDEPKEQKAEEIKKEQEKPNNSKFWIGIIIALVLGFVVFFYVIRRGNIESNK